MTGLTRWDPLKSWDPFKEMRDLQNRLSSLFGNSTLQGGDGKEETMTVAELYAGVEITDVPAPPVFWSRPLGATLSAVALPSVVMLPSQVTMSISLAPQYQREWLGQ